METLPLLCERFQSFGKRAARLAAIRSNGKEASGGSPLERMKIMEKFTKRPVFNWEYPPMGLGLTHQVIPWFSITSLKNLRRLMDTLKRVYPSLQI